MNNTLLDIEPADTLLLIIPNGAFTKKAPVPDNNTWVQYGNIIHEVIF
jgi:hypothetical protein